MTTTATRRKTHTPRRTAASSAARRPSALWMIAFVGMDSGGYYISFPIPFRENARIEVVNETGREVTAFHFHINYQQLEEPLGADVAYFHAQWKRTLRTSPGENYVVLDAEGQGHFVGLNMSLQGYENSLYFLEGDEMIYVDGEAFPSIYGTGTEDYFTSGWHFNRGECAGRYHGLILKNDSLRPGGRLPIPRRRRDPLRRVYPVHDRARTCQRGSSPITAARLTTSTLACSTRTAISS